ncbi:hypothetical protein [Actinomycetospora sp. CA-084318]|uniref:hypothetical protein n=1 Tax=Actinomycetospora sp. CA-084318 TaxID=3239892 RepID=UPI003D998064
MIAICRVLTAFEVDPVSRGVLMGQLREHLTAARGLTGRAFLGWLDDIDPTG